MTTTLVAAACPGCSSGTVRVGVSCWVTPLGAGVASQAPVCRRSVWADEPLGCSRGCRLSPPQVVAVLTGPAARHPYQLPLWTQKGAA